MPQVPDVKAEVMNRLRAVLPCPVVSKRPEGANTPPEFVRVIARAARVACMWLLPMSS